VCVCVGVCGVRVVGVCGVRVCGCVWCACVCVCVCVWVSKGRNALTIVGRKAHHIPRKQVRHRRISTFLASTFTDFG
jgi:hypothetical protein